MTSLNRFKQRLRGEFPTKEQPQLSNWLELVTEPLQDIPESGIIEEPECDAVVKVEEMTKAELDAYAAEKHGIQLDRRQTKINMITEFIQKLKEKN
jgi:hypothetical protein